MPEPSPDDHGEAGTTLVEHLVVLALMALMALFMGEDIRAARTMAPLAARIAWIPALGLDLSLWLDPLGLLFAGLILGIGLLVVIYAQGYLAKAEPTGRFLSFLMLFQGAMIGIALYIWFRFEWQFGVGALVTLFHDVAMVLGFFAVTQLPVDLNVVVTTNTVVEKD